MGRRLPKGPLAWVAVAAASLAVSACHHHDSVVPPVAATAAPSATPTVNPSASPAASASPSPASSVAPSNASTSVSLVAAGGSATLSANGLAGTFAYPAVSGATSTGAFSLTTAPVIPAPAPTGTPIVASTLQFPTAVAFASGIALSPVTVPTTSGANYAETFYDQTAGTQLGTSMGTITQGGVIFTASTITALTAGDVYLIVVSSY